MLTVVQSRAFMDRCKGKYSPAQIDDLVFEISRNPTVVGKRLEASGSLFRYRWTTSASGKDEYDVYFIFHSKTRPILLVNIFKRGAKAVLDKVLATLAEEITNP